MNPLIALICRILTGEKLEPSTSHNTAYWLSALVVLPVSIVGFSLLARWLESAIGLALDNAFFLIVFIVVFGLAILGAVFALAKLCIGRPGLLLLLSVGSWALSGFLMLRGI